VHDTIFATLLNPCIIIVHVDIDEQEIVSSKREYRGGTFAVCVGERFIPLMVSLPGAAIFGNLCLRKEQRSCEGGAKMSIAWGKSSNRLLNRDRSV